MLRDVAASVDCDGSLLGEVRAIKGGRIGSSCQVPTRFPTRRRTELGKAVGRFSPDQARRDLSGRSGNEGMWEACSIGSASTVWLDGLLNAISTSKLGALDPKWHISQSA